MEKIYTVDEIVNLTQAIIENPNDAELYRIWMGVVSSANIKILNEVVARLTSNRDYTPANIKAFREAIIATMNYKNSERIIETMTHLDKSANKLSNASLLLGIVGAILAAIQVLQAFGLFK